MVLGIAAFACLAVIFTLLLFLVYKLRPNVFKVRAAVTKWISVEVELGSPEPTNRDYPPTHLDRQQQTAATTLPTGNHDRPRLTP